MLTPASFFRCNGRSSPLPIPSAVLRGLAQSWDAYSSISRPDLATPLWNAMWVSDLDGRSERVKVSGTQLVGLWAGCGFVSTTGHRRCSGLAVSAGSVRRSGVRADQRPRRRHANAGGHVAVRWSCENGRSLSPIGRWPIAGLSSPTAN